MSFFVLGVSARGTRHQSLAREGDADDRSNRALSELGFDRIEQRRTRVRETKENNMCSPVKCKVCGKTTWAGCGQHIDAVRAMVPASQWCDGKHSAEEIAKVKGNSSFFGSLFGRR